LCRDPDQLYDLCEDPDELRNLAVDRGAADPFRKEVLRIWALESLHAQVIASQRRRLLVAAALRSGGSQRGTISRSSMQVSNTYATTRHWMSWKRPRAFPDPHGAARALKALYCFIRARRPASAPRRIARLTRDGRIARTWRLADRGGDPLYASAAYVSAAKTPGELVSSK